MDNPNEIILTPLQKANKKYYEKIKNNPEYQSQINKSFLNHYHNQLKNNVEFKAKVSAQKKEYYQKKKKEILLKIIL